MNRYFFHKSVFYEKNNYYKEYVISENFFIKYTCLDLDLQGFMVFLFLRHLANKTKLPATPQLTNISSSPLLTSKQSQQK